MQAPNMLNSKSATVAIATPTETTDRAKTYNIAQSSPMWQFEMAPKGVVINWR